VHLKKKKIIFVMRFVYVCVFDVKCPCKLSCLSWPGHSRKRDFNVSESFSW